MSLPITNVPALSIEEIAGAHNTIVVWAGAES